MPLVILAALCYRCQADQRDAHISFYFFILVGIYSKVLQTKWTNKEAIMNQLTQCHNVCAFRIFPSHTLFSYCHRITSLKPSLYFIDYLVVFNVQFSVECWFFSRPFWNCHNAISPWIHLLSFSLSLFVLYTYKHTSIRCTFNAFEAKLWITFWCQLFEMYCFFGIIYLYLHKEKWYIWMRFEKYLDIFTAGLPFRSFFSWFMCALWITLNRILHIFWMRINKVWKGEDGMQSKR